MKIGKNSLQYIIDSEENVSQQIVKLRDALPHFFNKYSMNPKFIYAAKVKPDSENEIEIHPLSREVNFGNFNLYENNYPVKFSGGFTIPDATTINEGRYKFHVHFSNKYLEKGL